MVYTDDSQCTLSNRKTCAGASYYIFQKGQEVKTGLLGLERRATTFDTEIFTLAREAAVIQSLVTPSLETQYIAFMTDNQTAATTIVNTSCHTAEAVSIIFCKHANTLLVRHPELQIKVLWTPSHCNLQGNDCVDALAKEVTALLALLHSTITWECETVKHSTLKAWQSEWTTWPHTNLASIALIQSNYLHFTNCSKAQDLSTPPSFRQSPAMALKVTTMHVLCYQNPLNAAVVTLLKLGNTSLLTGPF